MTNYTQQICINEKRSALERTVLAAEARERRELLLSQDARHLAQYYRDIVDQGDATDLAILGRFCGSLTGLVLAAEGVGL